MLDIGLIGLLGRKRFWGRRSESMYSLSFVAGFGRLWLLIFV